MTEAEFQEKIDSILTAFQKRISEDGISRETILLIGENEFHEMFRCWMRKKFRNECGTGVG